MAARCVFCGYAHFAAEPCNLDSERGLAWNARLRELAEPAAEPLPPNKAPKQAGKAKKPAKDRAGYMRAYRRKVAKALTIV